MVINYYCFHLFIRNPVKENSKTLGWQVCLQHIYHFKSSYKKKEGLSQSLPVGNILKQNNRPAPHILQYDPCKAVCNPATSVTLAHPLPIICIMTFKLILWVDVSMRGIFGDLYSFFSNAVPSLVEVEVTVVTIGTVVEGVGCKPSGNKRHTGQHRSFTG